MKEKRFIDHPSVRAYVKAVIEGERRFTARYLSESHFSLKAQKKV